MKQTLLASLIAFTPTLAAQTGPTWQVLTGSDYSMVADNGGGEVISGKAANSTLSFPFQLDAKSPPGAWSRHKSELVTSSQLGKGLRIRESGAAWSTVATNTSLAGTLDEIAPRHLEPHTLIVAITGTSKPIGVVTIVWNAHATAANSFATTSIDLNGDLTPEFAGAAGGSTKIKSFPVTATTAGYFFTIETNAGTDVDGIGSGSFGLDLTVYFRDGSSAVTITPYGAQCAGTLAGTNSTSNGKHQLTLNVTGAAKNALGVFVIGSQEASISLGVCDLLVAPAMLIPLHTDSVGAASEHFWVNAGFPFSLRTQGVTLSVSSSSLKLGSTNGLKIEG